MTISKQVVLPIIHLNGTSADSLIEDLVVAYRALCDASLAVKRTAPNQRDYYVGPPELWDAARKQHLDRMTLIDELQGGLVDQIAGIEDQARERSRFDYSIDMATRGLTGPRRDGRII